MTKQRKSQRGRISLMTDVNPEDITSTEKRQFLEGKVLKAHTGWPASFHEPIRIERRASVTLAEAAEIDREIFRRKAAKIREGAEWFGADPADPWDVLHHFLSRMFAGFRVTFLPPTPRGRKPSWPESRTLELVKAMEKAMAGGRSRRQAAEYLASRDRRFIDLTSTTLLRRYAAVGGKAQKVRKSKN